MNYEQTTKDTYNTISENWDEKRSYFWEPVIKFLEKQNKDNSLLDLGCGTGRHLQLAIKLGFKKENLLGSDYSENQLIITKEKGFKTHQANLTNLSLNQKFDNIICIAAFHHLLIEKDQVKALEEMRNILSKNGSILLSNWFPEKEFLNTQLKKKKFEYTTKDQKIVKVTYDYKEEKYDRYYYLFSEEELIELCNKANLKIRNKEYHKGNLYLELFF